MHLMLKLNNWAKVTPNHYLTMNNLYLKNVPRKQKTFEKYFAHVSLHQNYSEKNLKYSISVRKSSFPNEPKFSKAIFHVIARFQDSFPKKQKNRKNFLVSIFWYRIFWYWIFFFKIKSFWRHFFVFSGIKFEMNH